MSLIPPTRTPIAVLRSVACGMGEQVGLSEQVFWFSEWNACPELRRRSVWGLIEANPIHSWRQASKETAPSAAGNYPCQCLTVTREGTAVKAEVVAAEEAEVEVEVEVAVEVEVMVMVLAVVAENESSPAVPAPPPFASLG